MKLASRLCIIALLAFTGCAAKTTVTNLPANVTNAQVNNWINATADDQQAYTLTSGMLQTVVALNHMTPPVIPSTTVYPATLTGIGRAIQAEVALAQFLKTVPNNWSSSTTVKVNAYTQQILAQLAAANSTGILNVKNPNTGAAISDTITNIIKLINTIQQLASAPSASLQKPLEVSIARN